MDATRRRLLLAAAMGAGGATRARAQQEAPLRIIFSFAPGGAADAIARLLAEQLRAPLGRAVIVENRSGGGGRIGAQAVKAAAPDGATLLFAAATQMVLQPHTDPGIGYDPVADFRPIGQVMRFPQVLAVGPANPARTVADLVAWLRADAARCSFGSPGLGTGAHFAGIEFGRLAGVALEHVAYRGTPAAIPDLQTGRLGMFVASLGEFMEHHREGRVRILATADAARMPSLPAIPTLRESGFDVVAPGWFALYAPGGTPDAAAERWTQAMRQAVGSGPLRERMGTLGFDPTGTDAATLAAIQRADSAHWAAVVRASGFRPS